MFKITLGFLVASLKGRDGRVVKKATQGWLDGLTLLLTGWFLPLSPMGGGGLNVATFFVK